MNNLSNIDHLLEIHSSNSSSNPSISSISQSKQQQMPHMGSSGANKSAICINHTDISHSANSNSNTTASNDVQQQSPSSLHPPMKTSKYRGVSLLKGKGLWRARIECKGKREHLGYFESEIEAAMVYDDRVLEIFGKYSKFNFPQRIKDLHPSLFNINLSSISSNNNNYNYHQTTHMVNNDEEERTHIGSSSQCSIGIPHISSQEASFYSHYRPLTLESDISVEPTRPNKKQKFNFDDSVISGRSVLATVSSSPSSSSSSLSFYNESSKAQGIKHEISRQPMAVTSPKSIPSSTTTSAAATTTTTTTTTLSIPYSCFNPLQLLTASPSPFQQRLNVGSQLVLSSTPQTPCSNITNTTTTTTYLMSPIQLDHQSTRSLYSSNTNTSTIGTRCSTQQMIPNSLNPSNASNTNNNNNNHVDMGGINEISRRTQNMNPNIYNQVLPIRGITKAYVIGGNYTML